MVGNYFISYSNVKNVLLTPSPQTLLDYLSTNYPEATYYSLYQVGFCDFVIHYELCSMGINNIVVNPSDIPTTFGEKIRKTDAIDSCKLAKSLRSGILKSIYIPDKEILEIRNLVRLRFSLTKDLTMEWAS